MKKTEENCIRGCANVNLINENIKEINKLENQIERSAQVLNLAGSKTRLKILYIISKEDKVCVCDLSDILNISVSAISQHLRKLKDGNLLQSQKEGQTIYYELHQESKNTLGKIFKAFNYKLIKKAA